MAALKLCHVIPSSDSCQYWCWLIGFFLFLLIIKLQITSFLVWWEILDFIPDILNIILGDLILFKSTFTAIVLLGLCVCSGLFCGHGSNVIFRSLAIFSYLLPFFWCCWVSGLIADGVACSHIVFSCYTLCGCGRICGEKPPILVCILSLVGSWQMLGLSLLIPLGGILATPRLCCHCEK